MLMDRLVAMDGPRWRR